MNRNRKSRSFSIGLMLLFLALTLSPLATYGDIPPKINYQGYLTDSGGRPINVAVPIKFSIYEVATGGTAVWTETQDVSVNEGLFSVDLGALVPLTLTFDIPFYLSNAPYVSPDNFDFRFVVGVGRAF